MNANPAIEPPEVQDNTADLTIDDWADLDWEGFCAAMREAFEDKWELVLCDLFNSRSRHNHQSSVEVLENAMEKLLNREIERNVEWVRDWQAERTNGMDEE